MRPPQGATQTDQGLKSLDENEICSGRGDGAGCQSMARSTIWRIRSNHHCGSRRDERRLVAGAGHARRVLKLSSNCALVIGDLSFFAPRIAGMVGQRRSNRTSTDMQASAGVWTKCACHKPVWKPALRLRSMKYPGWRLRRWWRVRERGVSAVPGCRRGGGAFAGHAIRCGCRERPAARGPPEEGL